MRRNKEGASASGGDWSNTGTFLRKPPTGWLHEDHELSNGSFIDYEVYYLGCVEVKQSMRTLQFNVRTQVTKEAIVRLAEAAQKVFMGQKKRKVPKQITKILGDVDVRTTGDMNLSVSVEALRISSVAGVEVINHSLPSISFASGGDGPTSDFIGYVAKDPVHGRACHVFECPNSSQYVLATIGQAFELRYKMYLKTPRSNAQPVPVSDGVQGGDAWSRQQSSLRRTTRDDDIVTTPPAPPTPPPSYERLDENGSAGIYSDIPDLPPDVPPPLPSGGRNPYDNLPNFPPDIEAVSCSPSVRESVAVGGVSRLGNPYDTMPTDSAGFPSDGVYSDPGEVTTSQPPNYDDYEESPFPLVSIKQSSQASDPDMIDLTPAMPSHDYSNVGADGEILPETKPHPPKPPRPPLTAAKPTIRGSPGTAHSPLAGKTSLPLNKPPKPRLAPKPTVRKPSPSAEAVYDDPAVLERVKVQRTRPGTYDDVIEVMGKSLSFTNGDEENVYDDVDPGDDEQDAGALRSPKFDDTIYNRIPGNGQVGRSEAPDPLAPLPRQQYYHGQISRVEAEALLVRDGEFLVRESSKKPGQYVLTGMAGGKIQHLLLMDKQGKVKSKDREFQSIPDLVRYFRDKQSPLVIGDSQVFLQKPVVNAFLS